MGKFRVDSIADLSRQMGFTPLEVRTAQVAAAEGLLHEIDPAKAYPLDFVIFRITGYHPKQVPADLLTGLALQHDLGLLVETVSDGLDLHSAVVSEPVLGIEEVSEKFDVTSKTIQRWRRRGLPARRFIFPDGKRRVGFLVSSVERFFAAHRDQVQRGTNFSQVGDDERVEIMRRARRLATQCNCCVQEIVRRIGRKLNRSPLTILHTIRRHDQEQPEEAIFPMAPAELGEEQRQRIVRGHRRGLTLRTLSRRSCRPVSAIYRVLIDERLARLSRRKVKFIDDPLYHEPEAQQAIEAIAGSGELAGSQTVAEGRIPRDLPPYLRELYRVPLLSAAGERALFLKFNYRKYQFVTARRRIDPQLAKSRDINRLEQMLRQATEVKNDILRANLRLVVSVARKHLQPGISLNELISEGNLTLMRAVEGFDIHRGYRFSTYATLALMKGFARSVPMLRSGGGKAAKADERMLANVPDGRWALDDQRSQDRDWVRHLLQGLDDRERRVLQGHYGLDDPAGPATFNQLAAKLGLTAQRVRQIEQAAMNKLRAAAIPN